MHPIKTITRFVGYLPDGGDCGRAELAQMAHQVARLGLETLRHDPYLLAVPAPVPPCTGRATMLLDVFPGTAASARLAAANFDDAKSAEDVHHVAEQSAQCYNLLQTTDASFSLESDALGLKPVHTARTPGGNVFASRIADLLQLFPALADPVDTVAVYELMVFRSPLAQRTLHQRIRRTLPGGCYRWTPAAGLSTHRGREFRPAPVEPLRFMDHTIEAIHDVSGQTLLEKTAGASQPIVISLSGGFDSRLIAALCNDHQIPVRALSYGRPQNEEAYSARAVAKALGLELEMIHYRADNTLHHLDHQLETVEGTADPATSSMMHLLDTASAHGSSLLQGFGGDILAGSHVNQLSAAEYASYESLADGALRLYNVTGEPSLRNLFTPAVDMDEVRQDVLSGLRVDCPPHQAYLMWDFENRQRRYVGSQFSLLGDHFDTIMPFYDRRLLELWTSVPPIGLADRSVFRKLLARYYPALARIPHPEQPAPIIPNLHSQIGRFRRGLPKRALAKTLGAEQAKNVFLRFYRHDYIWNLGNLAAPQQRAHMLSTVEALRPTLKDVLGVELSSNSQAKLSTDLQALRGMFLAAEYARRHARRNV